MMPLHCVAAVMVVLRQEDQLSEIAGSGVMLVWRQIPLNLSVVSLLLG
jgi:hypothetical protein